MDRKKVDDLLDRAQEAREIAEASDVPELKAAMLKLAETYEQLARRACEKLEARCRRTG